MNQGFLSRMPKGGSQQRQPMPMPQQGQAMGMNQAQAPANNWAQKIGPMQPQPMPQVGMEGLQGQMNNMAGMGGMGGYQHQPMMQGQGYGAGMPPPQMMGMAGQLAGMGGVNNYQQQQPRGDYRAFLQGREMGPGAVAGGNLHGTQRQAFYTGARR